MEGKELREKGALLRYKNNLEIHIKTNKVKHFRRARIRAKEMNREKNPFGEEREKIKIMKKGANRVKYHRVYSSEIFQNWSTTNSLLKQQDALPKRENEKFATTTAHCEWFEGNFTEGESDVDFILLIF